MTQSPSSSAALADDRPCIGCGYNLRGASPDGACPECGLSVRRSLMGDTLATANPKWLGQMALGSGLRVLVYVVSLAWGMTGPLLLAQPNVQSFGAALNTVVVVALGLLNAVAYWFLTNPEPAALPARDPRALRIATRVLMVGVVPVLYIFQSVMSLPNSGVVMVALTHASIGLFAALASLWILRLLALRDRRPRLAAFTIAVMLVNAANTVIVHTLALSIFLAGAPSGPYLYSRFCFVTLNNVAMTAVLAWYAAILGAAQRRAKGLTT